MNIKTFKDVKLGDTLFVRLSKINSYKKKVTVLDIINLDKNFMIIKTIIKDETQHWVVNSNYNVQKIIGLTYLSTINIDDKNLKYKMCRCKQCESLGILQKLENFYNTNVGIYSYCKRCNNLKSRMRYEKQNKKKNKNKNKNVFKKKQDIKAHEIDYEKVRKFVKENYL